MRYVWNTRFEPKEKNNLTKAVLKYGEALMARCKEADGQMEAGQHDEALKTYIEIKSYKRFKACTYASQQLNKYKYKPDFRDKVRELEKEWAAKN